MLTLGLCRKHARAGCRTYPAGFAPLSATVSEVAARWVFPPDAEWEDWRRIVGTPHRLQWEMAGQPSST